MRRFTKALLFAVAMMLGWSLGGCSGPIKAEHLSNVRLTDDLYGLKGEIEFDRPWRGYLYFRYTMPDGSTEVSPAIVRVDPPWSEFDAVTPVGAVDWEFVRSETFRAAIRKPYTETFYVERIYHNPSGSSVWTVR